MPLLDHFHPPLAPTRSWEGLHSQWAGALAFQINQQLPENYFAEPQVHLGTQVEIDVATFDLTAQTEANSSGGTLVATRTWAPPAPSATASLVFPESVEVLILGSPRGGDRVLVAAIELVSPSNKDSPESRRAFAIKCAAYLQAGCGLLIVDVVTHYAACLHNELTDLLSLPEIRFVPAPRIYSVAYHPVRGDEGDAADIWTQVLTLGQALPTMPLFVRGLGPLPVDLEASYHEACVRNRIVTTPRAS